MQEEFDYAKTAPWAIETGVESSFVNLARALCVVSLKGIDIKVGVYLNPTDSTYYRMIVRALVETPEQIRFNSFPDPDEQDAVLRTSAILQRIFYDNLDLYCQFVQLGNNSQSMVGGDLQLGNAKEPYFYHTHIFCRGDPDRHYLGPDLPALGGVPVGKEASAQGNKRPWESPGQFFSAVMSLRAILLVGYNNHVRDYGATGAFKIEALLP